MWIGENGHPQTAFEFLDALKTALAALPESQRQVLVLRHIGGLSPNEIAERLGKTEASVQGLHHRGRAALKASRRKLGGAGDRGLGVLSRGPPAEERRVRSGAGAPDDPLGHPAGVEVGEEEQRGVLTQTLERNPLALGLLLEPRQARLVELELQGAGLPSAGVR